VNKKQEKQVEQLLCYMKSELDKTGRTCKTYYFNFTESKVMKYFNAPDEVLPDGCNLANFKKLTKIKNDDFTTILNYCVSNGYIKPFNNRENVMLSEDGRIYALSVEKAKLHKKFPDWLRQIIIGVVIFILGNVSMFFIMKGLK
jgi:hypothetical protein